MYKILVIMKNHTNGITSEVIEFDIRAAADAAILKLQDLSRAGGSSVREIIKLY